MKPKIFKPKCGLAKPHNHVGDTFRELVDLWEKNGYVEVVENASSPFVWFDKIGEGGVLLYDRPTMDWLPVEKPLKFDYALFANSEYSGNSSDVDNSSTQFTNNWIFWPRSPKILEQYASNELMYFSQRPFKTIFIGNIENRVQAKYREIAPWESVIEKFELTTGHQHKYSQREYLHLIQRAKFGLCLRGFGPKCNREIELMALGVVPLITADVGLTVYLASTTVESLSFLSPFLH